MARTSFVLAGSVLSKILFLACLLALANSSQAPTPISSFLNPHNQVRSQYGLPPLQWSYGLSQYAKWYANQRRNDCQMIHSSSNYGENIFWGKGKQWKPADAVAGWVAEKNSYDYNSNQCMPGKECLHYTQLVWRSTTRVGCAKITCTTGDTFIICNYDPHGNVRGQKPY